MQFQTKPVFFNMFFIDAALRDGPFNLQGGLWFNFSFRIFFQTTRDLEYLSLLSCKARIFFPGFNIRL